MHTRTPQHTQARQEADQVDARHKAGLAQLNSEAARSRAVQGELLATQQVRCLL
jgi:hypothetical protein